MELLINKDGLKKFLDLISLQGENQISEALLTVNKDTITTLIKSPTNTVGISATLKGKFEEAGEIGIDDLGLLKNSLKLQDKDDVSMKVKENKLVVNSKKTKVSLLLRKSDYIKNKPKEEDFNKYISNASGNEFTLTVEDISEILNAYNLIKSETINVSGDKKTIKFLFNKLDNEIETEILVKKEIQPFKTNISPFLLYLLNSLDGEVTLSIKKDVPAVLLTYKDDLIEIKYIVAPYGK